MGRQNARRMGMFWVWMLMGGMLAATGWGAQPATQEAKGARTPQQIMGELGVTSAALRQALGSADVLFDEAQRAEVAPKAIGPMKKMLALIDELVESQPMAKVQLGTARMQFLSMLALMGDGEAVAKLEEDAKGADAEAAATAKGAQLLVQWWKTAKDAVEQGKVIDELQGLVKASGQNSGVANAVLLARQRGAANEQLKGRIEQIILEDLKSEAAGEVAEEIRAERKRKGLEGKELVIEGTKLDGTKFSTAEWKGKVILVDFWASWYRPSVQELPRLKRVYADYHAKGLEIVGVSCDRAEPELLKFLMGNADMPWPQLFDKGGSGYHPVAKQCGVTEIPARFLIDRKGVVRSVDARENYEALIAKMLEEK
ncbi:MAG TPA: TlpA disulfide reductase family protein [Tepidisphaeraceae bacterium]|nr:TlpA disulfide reductase family protein [Tepidisphaeraceae bacterium]